MGELLHSSSGCADIIANAQGRTHLLKGAQLQWTGEPVCKGLRMRPALRLQRRSGALAYNMGWQTVGRCARVETGQRRCRTLGSFFAKKGVGTSRFHRTSRLRHRAPPNIISRDHKDRSQTIVVATGPNQLSGSAEKSERNCKWFALYDACRGDRFQSFLDSDRIVTPWSVARRSG